MSRRINADFDLLLGFLKRRNVISKSFSTSLETQLKAMHKKGYAFMIFQVELQKQKINEASNVFFTEALSDLLLALYCSHQGLNKPAKIQLRCAIENFVKAILTASNVDIRKKKNMYELFRIAHKDKHFSTRLGGKLYSKLHGFYKELCRTVHSDPSVARPINALKDILKDDENTSPKFSDTYVRCTDTLLEILFLNYQVVWGNMQATNREDFREALSLKAKREVTKELYMAE